METCWTSGWSGHNVDHYPAGVERVMAVEPSMLARHLASERIAAASVLIEFVDSTMKRFGLPDDESRISGVTTFALLDPCRRRRATESLGPPPRWRTALRRARLVTRSPGRRLAAPTPPLKRVVGGCHFDRPIGDIIEASGFELVELTFYLPGPKPPSYIYEGSARPT